ncbi:uncharacterized protein LOC128990914 [Macrosteles quadrilineatus]|uniref:uncharacterized protein LOC128990914 n=1 Tax=Macrosteles quadrilineatus TaxID=74068 RepID=UPI0023E18691|nr:uncharacterized protein LOC128990914 [Macrosteles quadrilineatus]
MNFKMWNIPAASFLFALAIHGVTSQNSSIGSNTVNSLKNIEISSLPNIELSNSTDIGFRSFPVRGPLYCFQCDSWLDDGCVVIKPPFDASNPLLSLCPASDGPPPFCQKIVKRSKIYKKDLVIRKCAWTMHSPPDCKEDISDDVYEINCQCFEHGCNGSSSLHRLGPLFVTLAGLTLLLSHVQQL